MAWSEEAITINLYEKNFSAIPDLNNKLAWEHLFFFFSVCCVRTLHFLILENNFLYQILSKVKFNYLSKFLKLIVVIYISWTIVYILVVLSKVFQMLYPLFFFLNFFQVSFIIVDNFQTKFLFPLSVLWNVCHFFILVISLL